MSEWVSIQTPPEYNIPVLVTCSKKIHQTGFAVAVRESRKDEDRECWPYEYHITTHEAFTGEGWFSKSQARITHWMPLTKPKGEA